mgnify:CR=1 FL=1
MMLTLAKDLAAIGDAVVRTYSGLKSVRLASLSKGHSYQTEETEVKGSFEAS